jgi:hypothetical protein
MHGSDRVSDLRDYKRAWVGKRQTINQSKMALLSECSLKCVRKVLDTADIVRDAIYRQVLPQATIFRVTKERWAQIGITIEFLIVVRTLGEFFRLRHVHGTNFSTAVAALYVGGALIAACSCWAGVTFYFFRRYTVSAWITLATVPILLVYKIVVIGG